MVTYRVGISVAIGTLNVFAVWLMCYQMDAPGYACGWVVVGGVLAAANSVSAVLNALVACRVAGWGEPGVGP